jgi:hypothetical protein
MNTGGKMTELEIEEYIEMIRTSNDKLARDFVNQIYNMGRIKGQEEMLNKKWK